MDINNQELQEGVKKCIQENPEFLNQAKDVGDFYKKSEEFYENFIEDFVQFRLDVIKKSNDNTALSLEGKIKEDFIRFFVNDPTAKARAVAADLYLEYVKFIGMAQKIAQWLGLEEAGVVPLMIKAGCWRRGGERRAEAKKKELAIALKKYQTRFDELKVELFDTSPSPHKLQEKIAEEEGVSVEHVYKVLNKMYSCQK